MTRQAYVLQDHKLIIFWTQKAACTSVSSLVARQILNASVQDIKESGGRGPRGYLNKKGYYIEGDKARQIAEENDYTTVALIRDPYDRLISAYSNKFLFYKNQELDSFEKLEPFARAFYKQVRLRMHGEKDGAQNYMGVSFAEMVTMICEMIDKRGKREPKLNNHFSTQVPFSFYEAGFTYDHLFNLKELDRFLATISELTGKSLSMPHSNTTRYSDENVKDISHESSLEILKKYNAVSKRQFDSEDLKQQIRERFVPDYRYMENPQVSS